MSQRSGQIQIQDQQQIQTLSPQQILVVKLLELSKQELEERIHAEVLDNPALETEANPTEAEEKDDFSEDNEGRSDVDDMSLGDYANEDDIPDYKLQEHNRSRGERVEEIPFSDTDSFYDVLKEQLAMQPFSEKEREIAEYLILSLDSDGFLRRDFLPMIDDLYINYGVETDEVELEKILNAIQEFDPAGIGARSLQECLLLQIRRKPDSPLKKIEQEIIENNMDDFTRKNKERIMQRLGISEEIYAQALAELVKLNPRPGSALGEAIGKNFQQIIPDFIVEKDEEGHVQVSLNNWDVPVLRLSNDYKVLLEEYTKNKENQSRENKVAFSYYKQKVDAAQGFINAVKQRQHTLMVTMEAIVKLQMTFFEEGDEAQLKPMILKDVAEITKLDISTISRVSNSKYVQTDFGIFPLRFFFSTGYKPSESGEQMSAREIRRILQELVDHEDKQQPLTDDQLVDVLKEKGYPIARRTVAKYRKTLNIPVARLRRI